MERYGYFFVSQVEENESYFSNKKSIITCIHNLFFKNLKDCINGALSSNAVIDNGERYYLKILKSADVVRLIHDKDNEHVYGYFYLLINKEENFEKINLISHCDILFNNMLDCVSAQKCYENNLLFDKENQACDIKIAYFMLLKDDDLLFELQKTCI